MYAPSQGFIRQHQDFLPAQLRLQGQIQAHADHLRKLGNQLIDFARRNHHFAQRLAENPLRQRVRGGLALGSVGIIVQKLPQRVADNHAAIHHRRYAHGDYGYAHGLSCDACAVVAYPAARLDAGIRHLNDRADAAAFAGGKRVDGDDCAGLGMLSSALNKVGRFHACYAQHAGGQRAYAAQAAQQIAQTGQVPRVETPTVPPTASQTMQTGRVPQIPPLAVPQLAQPSQPLLREQDTSDLGQLPEPIQQSQPIQQPQQQSQPIQQPANPLPPSFEPKPITAEISLIADPATGEVR